MDADLGSYCFKIKISVGASPNVFLYNKKDLLPSQGHFVYVDLVITSFELFAKDTFQTTGGPIGANME